MNVALPISSNAPPSVRVLRRQRVARLACAAAAGTGLAAARLAGVVHPGLGAATIALGTYVACVALADAVLLRRTPPGVAPFVLLAAADVAVIHVVLGVIAAPVQYVAALFLSLLALQLAHGARVIAPAVVVIAGTVLGSVALATHAVARGMPIWELSVVWLLPLYLGVAMGDVMLHARSQRRLAMLVALFADAERGDFERAYTADPDDDTDGLALIGRAYNRMRAELATMVLTDPLTATLNRRGFERELAGAVARAARDEGSLALLALDIDRFKAINDTAGHLAGDMVLRDVAALITSTARAGDMVGRVGGDELLVLLPNADLEDAGVVAERIAERIREHQFMSARGRETVTVSIGIAAELVRDPDIANALRARADEALYVGKRLGRDRVTLWAPGIRSQATPPHAMLTVGSSLLGEGLRRAARAD